MKIYFYSLLFLLALASCDASKKLTTPSSDLLVLQNMMTGTFNSAAQAAVDSNYYDITLQMYPIWKDRPGTWLYVEQSVTANQAKPYRQRIYKLEKVEDKTYASHVYLLPNPENFIGKWKTPAAFDALKTEDIILKDGCAVMLKKESEVYFAGSTGDKTCGSNLRGAMYAMSDVKISQGKIVSWDQGFDATGKQVWGATKGGYIFLKNK